MWHPPYARAHKVVVTVRTQMDRHSLAHLSPRIRRVALAKNGAQTPEARAGGREYVRHAADQPSTCLTRCSCCRTTFSSAAWPWAANSVKAATSSCTAFMSRLLAAELLATAGVAS